MVTTSEVDVPAFLSDDDRRYVEKSGMGGRMGWGETPAVLVVDMTNEFTREEYALGRGDTGRRAVDAIGRLLTTARDAGVPVYYTRREDEHPVEAHGVWGEKMTGEPTIEGDANGIHPDLEPGDAEVVLGKGKPSAFFDTPLASMLRTHGVDTVVVTGMVTSGCVRATVVDACSHNFRVVVPRECVADRVSASHDLALFEMDWKYADVTSLSATIDRLDDHA